MLGPNPKLKLKKSRLFGLLDVIGPELGLCITCELGMESGCL